MAEGFAADFGRLEIRKKKKEKRKKKKEKNYADWCVDVKLICIKTEVT
jgi:hypothetical protein